MKKLISMMIVISLGSTLMFSQDLSKIAQKEKERRAQLKKKSDVVVTNADLFKTERAAILRTTPPEAQAQNIQRATPQDSQRMIPSESSRSESRMTTEQIENIDQIDIRVDKTDQLDQLDTRSFTSDYAFQVLNSNGLVRNPELALDKPDGQFAEIPLLGFIDLEIITRNGPGADIAVYARQTGVKDIMSRGAEAEGMPVLSLFFDYPEGFWYGVLGMNEQGNWVKIGQGKGWSSPEEFDLGSLVLIKKIRIMFKPHSNADLGVHQYRAPPGESLIGIDAIESIHR